MENLNAEKSLEELEFQARLANLSGGRVLISAKCATFILQHARLYEERIKELTEENDKLHESCTELARVQEENERLERICESYALQYGTVADKEVFLKQERSDTVRKMLSEIKERCLKGGIYPSFVASTIDQIANEMLEGTHDD